MSDGYTSKRPGRPSGDGRPDGRGRFTGRFDDHSADDEDAQTAATDGDGNNEGEDRGRQKDAAVKQDRVVVLVAGDVVCSTLPGIGEQDYEDDGHVCVSAGRSLSCLTAMPTGVSPNSYARRGAATAVARCDGDGPSMNWWTKLFGNEQRMVPSWQLSTLQSWSDMGIDPDPSSAGIEVTMTTSSWSKSA